MRKHQKKLNLDKVLSQDDTECKGRIGSFVMTNKYPVSKRSCPNNTMPRRLAKLNVMAKKKIKQLFKMIKQVILKPY